MRNEEQGRGISSSFFIIRLAKFKETAFNSESFACQIKGLVTEKWVLSRTVFIKQSICMFGYWENEAEEKFNLTGFEEEPIGLKQISIRSCSQSQEITTPRSVRFFGPNQTGPLYVTIVLQWRSCYGSCHSGSFGGFTSNMNIGQILNGVDLKIPGKFLKKNCKAQQANKSRQLLNQLLPKWENKRLYSI